MINPLLSTVVRSRNKTVTVVCPDDYPHKEFDADGTFARNWVDRQRRSLAKAASRAGVPGETLIDGDGCLNFRKNYN